MRPRSATPSLASRRARTKWPALKRAVAIALAVAASPPALAAPTRDVPAAVKPARRELSPRAQRLFDEAVAAAEEGKRLKVPTDWETLERRWRAVVEAEPVPEAWFNLGVVLEHRKKPDGAREAYRKAAQLDASFAAPAVNLALLDEPRDPAAAAQLWKDLLQRFPHDPVPRARLAALYAEGGQGDEAWRLAREALLRDPRAVAAYKVMMRVALERGNADLAHLLAVKALKIDDADPEVVSFVGDVLVKQRDEGGAVAQWKKALSLQDDYLPARRALLERALAKGHWEGVAEQARAILAVTPDARTELALGMAYRYLGEGDKALAAYDEAEKLSGGRLPEVHLARGVALMKAKDRCEPAVTELRRYQAAAGPAAAESAAGKLERECMQIIAANRQAEEAARELKEQAERQAPKATTPAKGAQPAAPAKLGPATPRSAGPTPPVDGDADPTR